MRRKSLILSLATALMLLLSVNAFGQYGDVHVYTNGNTDLDVIWGQTNHLEIHILNDTHAMGMSLGFEFTWDASLTITWNTDYDAGVGPVQQFGDAVGVWDLGGFMQANRDLDGTQPDFQLIGGAALSGGLPVHAVLTMLYEMEFDVGGTNPGYPGITGGFVINNYFVPPAGTWNITMGGPVAPDYQGNPNSATNNPDAPDVLFDVYEMPCMTPAFLNCPTPSASQAHCDDFDYDFNVDPVDPTCTQGEDDVTYVASVGTINAATGEYTLTAPGAGGCGSQNVVITATNCCGSSVDCDFDVIWSNSDPTITNCPTTTGLIAKGNPWSYDFNSQDADWCDPANWSVVHVSPPDPVGLYDIGTDGLFTFNTDDLDGGQTFCFNVTVDDGCGGTDVCYFCVEVLLTEPFVIHIEKTHGTLQGHYEYISITKEMGSELMGGFDFLIAYDASALAFMSAKLGPVLDPTGCGWEYFTYRFGAVGNCGNQCPSGFLRLVAIADQNNGPNHPSCFGGNGELVELKFYVTNDRTYECMYVPIRFAWFDCGDNGISSVTGDTLFISTEVYDYEWDGDLGNDAFKITGIDCPNTGYHIGGACAECDVSDKTEPVRFIYFWNGGVDIVCADSIDRKGDLNLNGIAHEIADAVVYTNYFLFGVIALDIEYEAQVAASDVNNDGMPLTVGDLVYLVRVITGDALPFPKLAPFANAATLNVVNGTVSTEAASEIGAVWATFSVNGAYDIVTYTDMELISNESEGTLKVLVYSGLDNMTNRIPAGNNELFNVSGNVELINVEAADYNGSMLDMTVNKTTLPTDFALMQNVPNPFNPATRIGFDLPVVSDWTIDIYNVAGQLVKSLNGRGVGSVVVTWDASNVASGIYFYKATAGSFTDTKKMVLMK